MNHLGLLNDILKKKVAVEKIDSRRTPAQTVEVWAQLRNRTDYTLQVEGRVQFFDAKETPIEGPTGWTRIILPPNGINTYRGYSTKIKDIAYYYIEIREG